MWIHESLPSINHGANPVKRLSRRSNSGVIVRDHDALVVVAEAGFSTTDVTTLEKYPTEKTMLRTTTTASA